MLFSPSTINLFLKDPALWVIKQYHGMAFNGNIYTMRGQLVENYLDQWLKTGKEVTDIQSDIISCLFTSDIPWDISDVDSIMNFYNMTMTAWSNVGKPDPIMQLYIECPTLGIKGYLDYTFNDSFIDLKTAAKLPTVVTRGPRKDQLSKSKIDNVRQQICYEMVTKKAGSLLYVSEDDWFFYEITDKDRDELTNQIVDTIEQMGYYMTMPYDSLIKAIEPGSKQGFHWTEELINIANEIWR